MVEFMSTLLLMSMNVCVSNKDALLSAVLQMKSTWLISDMPSPVLFASAGNRSLLSRYLLLAASC